MRGLRNPHCVLGTLGQQKLRFTLLPRRVVVESDNRLCVSLDLLTRFQQAILSKRHRDPFTNPKLDRLLTEMPTQRISGFVRAPSLFVSSMTPPILAIGSAQWRMVSRVGS